jgi:hypothetical protein
MALPHCSRFDPTVAPSDRAAQLAIALAHGLHIVARFRGDGGALPAVPKIVPDEETTQSARAVARAERLSGRGQLDLREQRDRVASRPLPTMSLCAEEFVGSDVSMLGQAGMWLSLPWCR